jgi:diguanylate cyclase (GGDEF)-like protein
MTVISAVSVSNSVNAVPKASNVERLFAKQLARARDPSGGVQMNSLAKAVIAVYEDYEIDRSRVERSSALMAVELQEVNNRLKKASHTSQLQSSRFEAALNNMSQGLCMFDGSLKLTVYNNRLMSLLNIQSDLNLHEKSFYDFYVDHLAEVLPKAIGESELSLETGIYLSLQSLKERTVLSFDCANGRMLLLTHEPTKDGGFVHTFEDITARKIAEEKALHLASHDVLTDLPNRRMLNSRLDALSERSQESGFSVFFVDLDRFKSVNDTLGHSAGDKLLLAVTKRLRSCVRSVDTVARLGGDEFAIIAPDMVDENAAAVLAHRLISAVSRPYEIDGSSLVIGASIGIAMAPRDGGGPEHLIRQADLALYQAKAAGKGCYRFFTPSMDETAKNRRAIEMELRLALDEEHFETHFQPLVNLEQQRICGFEALLRWNSPTRGRVSPDDFIPIAEELGLIKPIGEWVLIDACTAATTWPSDLTVAVNVSVNQFDRGFIVSSVKKALELSGLEPSRLELEITESVLLDKSGETLSILHQLRMLGVKIVMDDFGTGYSSLAYLRSFPFDKVKIDRSFINGLGQRADSIAIVKAVTSLCNSLGIATTAEGVETKDQLGFLNLEKCTQVQGYLFSKPRPKAEIKTLIGDVASLEGRFSNNPQSGS